jgi:hypothetical protein
MTAMPSRTFTIDELEEVSYENVFKDGRGKRRWSETFDIVFLADDDLHYHVLVEEGHTEDQDYYGSDRFPECRLSDDGYMVVDCPEVEIYQTMLPVTKFRKISDIDE